MGGGVVLCCSQQGKVPVLFGHPQPNLFLSPLVQEKYEKPRNQETPKPSPFTPLLSCPVLSCRPVPAQSYRRNNHVCETATAAAAQMRADCARAKQGGVESAGRPVARPASAYEQGRGGVSCQKTGLHCSKQDAAPQHTTPHRTHTTPTPAVFLRKRQCRENCVSAGAYDARG